MQCCTFGIKCQFFKKKLTLKKCAAGEARLCRLQLAPISTWKGAIVCDLWYFCSCSVVHICVYPHMLRAQPHEADLQCPPCPMLVGFGPGLLCPSFCIIIALTLDIENLLMMQKVIARIAGLAWPCD